MCFRIALQPGPARFFKSDARTGRTPKASRNEGLTSGLTSDV